MAINRPTIVDVNGNVSTVPYSDGGRPALSGIDIGANLLGTLNLIVTTQNQQSQALSTGETDPTYFQDVKVDSLGTPFSLVHNKGRRVRYQVVDCMPTTTGQPPQLERHGDATLAPLSTDNTLVLRSYRAGTMTIRVW